MSVGVPDDLSMGGVMYMSLCLSVGIAALQLVWSCDLLSCDLARLHEIYVARPD